MKNFVFISLLFTTIFDASAQETFFDPIDTVETPTGTMLIYGDRTWSYLGEEDFEGIMNARIHEMVCDDTTYSYKSKWSHEDVITCTTNDVSLMKDTLWMCVLDTLHDNYAIPFDGTMTSKYGYRRGRRHNGVDIDLETGDTICAAFDGKIRYAKYHENGFGNLIVIRHYNGLETYYAHCSKLMVAPNQDVKAGDPIGLGGNTGHSTGSHLHFEVRFYDNPINPELIFDFKQKAVKDNLLVHSGVFSPSGGSTKRSSSSSSSSSAPVNTNAKTHRVRSGESLWIISRKYGTSVAALCKLNGLSETSVLNIGQVIRLK
ncbi:MAG: hypothetical protein ACI8ZM_003398 [Crocinitomix sp.]|jgi:hypothetical protein